MSTPPTDPGRPSPDDDQGRSTPWGGTPWGAAPWGGPPAPSGYEAQLPCAGDPSGGTPGQERTLPASPYAAPSSSAAPAPGSPYAGPGYPPGQNPAAPYPPAPYPASPYPAASYPGSPPPGSPYPPTPFPYGGYPAWSPPPPQQTDGLAVASLVVSCSSLVVGLSAPVGLGLGIAALRRIRRTGAQGRGLAIAGIVIGGIMTAAAVVMVAFFVLFAIGMGTMATSSGWDSSSTDDTWSSSEMPTFVLQTDLRPGDCLLDVPGTYDLSDAVAVDCGEPHGAEVLSTLAMSAPVLADLDAWDPTYTELTDRCASDAAALLEPGSVDEIGWSEVFYPHPDEWADGGRTAYCVLGATGTLTGSVTTGTLAGGAGTTT